VQTTAYNLYRRFGVPRLFRYADLGQWDKIPDHVAGLRNRRRGRHPGAGRDVDDILWKHRYAPADTALHRLVRSLVTSGDHTRRRSARKNSDDDDNKEDDGACDDCRSRATGSSSSGSSTTKSNRRRRRHATETTSTFVEDDANAGKWLLGAIESILEANSNAATVANLFGQLPLHLACMNPTIASQTCFRGRIVLLLVRHAPETASVTDKFGKTPLQYLIECTSASSPLKSLDDDIDGVAQRSLPADVAQVLLLSDERALRRRNGRGETLIDIAWRKNPSWVRILKRFTPVAP